MAGWSPVSDKDSFIAWLRSEFAASNAITDVLLEHLTLTSGPGELDDVARWVQCRRSGWNPVLHMQQFASVGLGELVEALKQVRLRKQSTQMENQGLGFVEEENSSAYETDEKKSDDLAVQNGEISSPEGDGKQKDVKIPKLFVPDFMAEGSSCNELEGLALYEDFLEESSISELISYLHEMRGKGFNGELQGRTMVVSPRPKNGHGKQTLQFGLPITDGTLNKIKFDPTNTSMVRVEPIPSVIQDFFDRILDSQVLEEKPNYCVVDFLNENEYLHPHHWKSWYGTPICTLFLTECDVVYGKLLVSTPHYGDYTGSLRLPLSSGSVLVMQGKSLDIAKRAILSQPTKRIILTFGKSPRINESNTYPTPYKTQPYNPSYNQAPSIYQNYSPSVFRPVTPLFMRNPNPGNYFPNQVNYFLPSGNSLPVPGTGVFMPDKRQGKKSVTNAPPVSHNTYCNDHAIQEVIASGIDEFHDGNSAVHEATTSGIDEFSDGTENEN